MSRLLHLVRRFFGSLRPGGPSTVDDAWAVRPLSAGEVALWRRMSNADRRHAVGVARRVVADLGADAHDAVVAAALLHDVGKLDSGLGTLSRVAVTVLAGVLGRERLAAGSGRMARYLRHDELGAGLLASAGADSLTIAWTREHHSPPSTWTVQPDIAAALKSADED